LRGRERGHRCGEIIGLVREQSPENLMDFLRQRRRWFLGMRSIRHLCARYVFFQSCVGLLVNVYTLTNFFFPDLNLMDLPNPIILAINFQISVYVYIYSLGVVMQDLDHGFKWNEILMHVCMTIACIPMASLLENFAIVYAVLFKTKLFEVIRK
jgi:cellulose synthase/poly-beta-1,6-N-acetylglucosamine synthase-like glycosyltransferase